MLSRRPSSPPELALVVVLATCSCTGAEEVMETYEDGAQRLVYEVDDEGRRHGAFEELWPSGETKAKGKYRKGEESGSWSYYYASGELREKRQYKAGLLHGKVERRRENGKLWIVASYRRGVLASPIVVHDESGRPVKRIEYPLPRSAIEEKVRELGDMEKAPMGYVETPVSDPPFVAGQLGAACQEQALRVLQLYRFLAGLRWQDLVLDPQMSLESQHAAVVLAANAAGIDHSPPRPAGMDAKFFGLGRTGCEKGNLHIGASYLSDSVHGLIYDSWENTIGDVCHRRYMLRPQLRRVGFGHCEGYTAMWAHDASGSSRPCGDITYFPSRGWFPVELLDASTVWSLSLHKGVSAKTESLKVRVQKLDADYSPVEGIDVDSVSVHAGPPFPVDPALLFRPLVEEYEATPYWVEIAGLSGSQAPGGRLSYVVHLVPTALSASADASGEQEQR